MTAIRDAVNQPGLYQRVIRRLYGEGNRADTAWGTGFCVGMMIGVVLMLMIGPLAC